MSLSRDARRAQKGASSRSSHHRSPGQDSSGHDSSGRGATGQEWSVESLERFYRRSAEVVLGDSRFEEAHEQLLRTLESGKIRAATRQSSTVWQANEWVKVAILLGFRGSRTEPSGLGVDGTNTFYDRSAYPVRRLEASDDVRFVPGGSAVRRGSHVAPGVVIMPPAYINVGAWVGAGTMVDSHALVGSCAQIGERVHLSAAAQIGGVLEPPGSCPVVIEDGAFIGGQSGVYEGVVIGERAVLAAGTQITASTTIVDLARETTHRGIVPPGAVVVPGARSAGGAFAASHGLSIYCPIVVKYRDDSTDASTALEDALR